MMLSSVSSSFRGWVSHEQGASLIYASSSSCDPQNSERTSNLPVERRRFDKRVIARFPLTLSPVESLRMDALLLAKTADASILGLLVLPAFLYPAQASGPYRRIPRSHRYNRIRVLLRFRKISFRRRGNPTLFSGVTRSRTETGSHEDV